MTHRQPIEIVHRGQTYSAAWHVEKDGRLIVASDYGTGSSPLDGRDPNELAAELMRKVLEQCR
jgi:hypothetical protein